MSEEEQARKYSEFYSGDFGRAVLIEELKFVESRLKGRENILSIGCGPAFLETRLKKRHPSMSIVALDNAKQMIAQAEDSVHLVRGNAEHLGFSDSVFDAVLCVTSLEFIEDYEKALEETHRVLVSGGTILILILNPESDYFRDRYGQEDSYIRRNMKHMDIREMEESVSAYFSVENQEYYLGIEDGEITDTCTPDLAGLYVLEGSKRDK